MLISVKTHFMANKEKIFKRLRIQENTSAYAKADQVFPALLACARQTIQLTNCYTVSPNLIDFQLPQLRQCHSLVFCFASCGNAIATVIHKMFQEGAYLEGYLLDDLSNELLWNACQQMNQAIKSKLQGEGLNLTQKYAPGEGALALTYQKVILEFLQSQGKIEAYMTKNFMLSPEKSMLYVFGADAGICPTPLQPACTLCNNLTCYFRTDPN